MSENNGHKKAMTFRGGPWGRPMHIDDRRKISPYRNIIIAFRTYELRHDKEIFGSARDLKNKSGSDLLEIIEENMDRIDVVNESKLDGMIAPGFDAEKEELYTGGNEYRIVDQAGRTLAAVYAERIAIRM